LTGAGTQVANGAWL